MKVTSFARAPLALGIAALGAVAMLATPMLSAAKPEAPVAPPVAAEQSVAPASAQQAQIEFLTIRQALAEAEQTALQDPALRTAHDTLQTSIQAAMRTADAKHDTKVARLQQLEQELQAGATGEPDMAKLQPLITEAQGLQDELLAIQVKVVESEPLKSDIAKMREQMLAKMTTVNPEVPKLLGRLEALAQSMNQG